MSDDKAGIIKAFGNLTFGVVALLLLAVALWMSQEDRRFEADRADADRLLALEMLKRSVETQEAATDAASLRAKAFLSQQQQMIVQGDRIAQALEAQGLVLQDLNEESEGRVHAIKKVFQEENQRLIEVLKTPPEERQQQ